MHVVKLSLATFAVSAFLLSTSFADSFDLKNISVPRISKTNKCSSLGGKSSWPSVTITHSAVAGVDITLTLIDKNTAGWVRHGSIKVKSSASGKTVIPSENLHRLLSPCNRSAFLSSYYFVAKAKGATTIEHLWGH